MGCATSTTWPPPRVPMRCRDPAQVPKCFRSVECPYAPGQTLYGRWGAINYSFVGPPDGEVVVCFHGLNGSRLMFNDLGAYISNQGRFRVLAFDLYGHGLSNAPKVDLCPCRGHCVPSFLSRCFSRRGRYDLDFFVDQTEDVLSLLGIAEEPVSLVGFSLGGTIALAYAIRHPTKVRRIVAISPAGYIPKVPPTYYLLKAFWLCAIPAAPHCICTCWYQRERFARGMRNQDPDVDDEVVESMWKRFVWQLYIKRGVASATLATCNRVPIFNARTLFQEVGQHSRPVLLVWGEQDSLNPPHTVGQTVRDCFSNVQMMVVRQAGHIAICDQPRQVVLSILDFLRHPPDADMRTVKIAVPAPLPKRQVVTTASVPPRIPSANSPSDAQPSAQPSGCTPQNAHCNGDAAAVAAEFLYGTSCASQVERAAQMPVPVILGVSREDGISDSAAGASSAAPGRAQFQAGSIPPMPVVDEDPDPAGCRPVRFGNTSATELVPQESALPSRGSADHTVITI